MWYGVRGHGEEEPFSLWFCPVRKLMLSVSDRGTDHREDRAMSFVAVAVGALAVASATYLIFDLSGPYSGIFRASSGRSNRCWRSWAKSDRFAYVVTMSSLQPGVIDRFRPAPPMGSRRRREWFMDVVRLDLDEADHRKRAAIESLGEPADNNEDEAARD
jgi:hypothetical protein